MAGALPLDCTGLVEAKVRLSEASREGGQRVQVDPDQLVDLGCIERAALEAADQ